VISARAYIAAALADDAHVDVAFASALEAARPQPLSLVRAHTTYAERLAVLGRHDECVAQLRAARQTAEAISAPAAAQWVDRVAGQLQAPRAASAPPAELGGLEHSVASAVVAGRSVAEAGQDVLVSEATAGQLLRSALRSTGATSLDALARRLGDPAPAAGTTDPGETWVVVLGRFGVLRGGELHPGPAGVPGRALRILALRRSLHVEELSELLWPGADVDLGRPRLRNVVSRIRSAVGPVVDRREDLLVLAPEVVVDSERFEQLARQALAVGRTDPEEAGARAAAAVELYAGPLLPDAPYDEWAVGDRERVRRRFVALLDLLAEGAAARGEVDAAPRPAGARRGERALRRRAVPAGGRAVPRGRAPRRRGGDGGTGGRGDPPARRARHGARPRGCPPGCAERRTSHLGWCPAVTRAGTPQGRPPPSVRPVMVAYVLRLRLDALVRGAVVGELEDVDTGARVVVRSAQELLDELHAAGAPAVPLPSEPGD
jgi:hypothetical protein